MRIISGEICKLKWKTVRDSYIKYKRQLMNSDGTREIDYIWSSNLKFLDNHNVNRRSFYHTLSKQAKTNKRAAAESLKAREDLANEISSSPPPLGRLGSLTMVEGSSASLQSNQNLLTNKGDPKTKFKEIDATDLLFLSYSATFKKFPARQQTFMKLELAKFFANAELQQLDDAEQSRVESAENFHIIIKTEYADKGESEISEFSDDVTKVIPAKLKRRDSVPEQ